MKIGLIPCGKRKRDFACQAKYMYTAPLFRMLYGYALAHCDKVYILSAKWGLLDPDDVIGPYNKTLKDSNAEERKLWTEMVLAQMKFRGINLDDNEYIILAGIRYHQYLLPHLKHVELPVRNMDMFKQLSALQPYMIPLETQKCLDLRLETQKCPDPRLETQKCPDLRLETPTQ